MKLFKNVSRIYALYDCLIIFIQVILQFCVGISELIVIREVIILKNVIDSVVSQVVLQFLLHLEGRGSKAESVTYLMIIKLIKVQYNMSELLAYIKLLLNVAFYVMLNAIESFFQ